MCVCKGTLLCLLHQLGSRFGSKTQEKKKKKEKLFFFLFSSSVSKTVGASLLARSR